MRSGKAPGHHPDQATVPVCAESSAQAGGPAVGGKPAKDGRRRNKTGSGLSAENRSLGRGQPAPTGRLAPVAPGFGDIPHQVILKLKIGCLPRKIG